MGRAKWRILHAPHGTARFIDAKSHQVMERKGLVYQYKLINGAMSKAGGATALFIDWIGVGGGVGPGFHGVEAATRGVGLRPW